MNIDDVHFAAFPDNAFDTIPFLHIVKWIEGKIADFAPDLIFTHHAGDLNIDHCITHRATLTAFRPLPSTKACTVLGFEVLSSTECASPSMALPFVPTAYINISSFLDKKLESLGAYAAEMRDFPHPRSVEGVKHLAHLRGCHCGVIAAEAFMVLRMVL